MSSPWKTLSSARIYDNPWIAVNEHEVIHPGGGRGKYGVINFKNLAIGIIPLDESLNTWLVGQHRYPLDAYSWEIPMGGCPLGTDPLEGARRELKEETGLTAARWSELMRLHTSNCVTDELGVVYIARELTPGPPQFDEFEQLDVRKLPLLEAVDMVMQGTITDGISVAGLLKLRALLEHGQMP